MKKESNGTTIVKNFMKSQGSVFIILLVMCIIASIFTDKFLSVSNLSNVLTQSVTLWHRSDWHDICYSDRWY